MSKNESGGKLLVVDDNEMNRDMLSRRLVRRGYEVSTAEGGGEALERLAAEPFDAVLLDINMPGVDGLEVLETVRRSRGPADLPVIMATARDASEDVVRALKLGANDYVTKPLDFPVVLARVKTQLALKRARDAVVAAHDKIKRQLEAAARLQLKLLPEAPPELPGLHFSWRYVPCDELAGDVLNVVALDDRYAALYVLDVCGHGVRSSLLSVAMTHTLSRRRDTSALTTESIGAGGHRVVAPADVAERLSALFPMESNDNLYATLGYAVVDASTGEFRLVCAGHPAALLLRADGTAEEVGITGIPIGMSFPGVASTYENASARLEVGDRLYVFSDGLVEEEDATESQFGRERFVASLRASLGETLERSIERLFEELTDWSGDGSFSDDLSIVAVERHKAGGAGSEDR